MAQRVMYFGLLRSGTTLVCDLLTQPGRSVILPEPELFWPWRQARMRELVEIARKAQLDVDSPPEDHPSRLDWFKRNLFGQLNRLDVWGIKEVHFDFVGEYIDLVQPNILLLSIRDLRDIYLSALELILHSKLAFPTRKHMRDEAWLISRIKLDCNSIECLRTRANFILRYEDLVESTKSIDTIAGRLGLDTGRIGNTIRSTTTGGTRRREVARHGSSLSRRSVGRWRTLDQTHHLANLTLTAQQNRSYMFANSYDHGLREEPPSWLEVDQDISPEQLNHPFWIGLEQSSRKAFNPAFAKRRARLHLSRVLPAGSRVLEIGSGLPCLRYLTPQASFYAGLDDFLSGEAVIRCDWIHCNFPVRLDEFTDVVFSNSAEYVNGLHEMLSRFRASGVRVHLCYHSRDDNPDINRGMLGWVNDYSTGELVQTAVDCGYGQVRVSRIDDRQTYFGIGETQPGWTPPNTSF